MKPDQHPYCYPGTDVLRNKLDSRNKELLEAFERVSTANRLETLPRAIPLTPQGYCRIHRYLLQDVYDWAVEYRRVNTGRTGPFYKAQFIAGEMEKRFAALHAENDLGGLAPEQFAMRAAEHVNELNAIHPFLDGNGRTIRAFLEILATQAGHELDLARIGPGAWNEASKQGFHRQHHAPLRDVIASALVGPVLRHGRER